MDHKKTLNLPQTDFPMKADLVRREPDFLKKWQEMNLYQKILEKNEGRPRFILHDGPPYANGNIHFGHILNKTLKDILIKYKTMTGFYTPYIPGWDCHGLPIEHQVDKELGAKKKTMSISEIRKACREYAKRFVDIQRREFERFGVFGDWDHPYLTMSYDYEASIAREFGRFATAGNIYKGKKPVLWCPHCQTALAEAEIEYEEHESPSVYVRFPLIESPGGPLSRLSGKKISVVIWTTTPWTLPANLAVALHPNYDYVAIPVADEYFIVAKNLAGAFCQMLGIEPPEPVERFSGRKLEKLLCRHPFIARSSLLILSSHVTLDTGTGCVHIAPGHGEEDFVVGREYGLETLTPVDPQGNFTAECGVPEWVGQNVFQMNPRVVERLKQTGTLLQEQKIRHNYPHCWRCKNPVIFRATWQWFLSLEKNDLREKALDAIRRVQWIPPWGQERISGMIEKRPDWCLSRQRSWGVPIIAFRCRQCEFLLLDASVIEKVAQRIETQGSDVWFMESAESFLGKKFSCPKCHGTSWEKEQDILDVWFDSGVSFAAVVEKNPQLQLPADLYLEGSDQHRGWFQSSLLASVGTRGKAPFKLVLTHGFVVDGEGRKYSKSARNYIPPKQVLEKHGAEILRLWTAAEDYRTDIRFSNEILTRLVDAYRKIRNTGRFLLGNLYDFDPQTKSEKFEPIDLWALHSLQKLIGRIRQAYEEYNFHLIFHELNRFCTVDLSAFYLDVLKDRLYTSSPHDPGRRAAQRVFFETASTLARLVAPILPFTAEDLWAHLPSFPGKNSSVHLTAMPEQIPGWINESLASQWDRFWVIRSEILKALEKARMEKRIGSSLEAKVILFAEGDPKLLLKSFGDSLKSLLIVSQITWGVEPPENAYRSELVSPLSVVIEKAEGQKCARCWNFSRSVGKSGQHPELCERCTDVLEKNR